MLIAPVWGYRQNPIINLKGLCGQRLELAGKGQELVHQRLCYTVVPLGVGVKAVGVCTTEVRDLSLYHGVDAAHGE